MTALMGIPILGERPSAIDWAAIAVISTGVYAVSGGPLPMLRRREVCPAGNELSELDKGGRGG